MDWFERIYDEHYDVLYSIAKRALWARRITHVSVDDVIQDTFLDLYKARKKAINHANIGGWLVVTLLNNIRAAFRRTAKMPISLEAVKERSPGFEAKDTVLWDDPMWPDTEEMIQKIRMEIGDAGVELLNRHYVDGVPLTELAQAEGISGDAMKMKLYRLRKRVKNSSTRILTLICVTFLRFIS